MTIRKSILLSAVALAFAAPGFSSATSLWYPEKGDSGGEFRADHFQSTKTRSEVLQEVQVARQDGSLLSTSELERGITRPAKTVGTPNTRAEVINDQVTMSAQTKVLAHDLYHGS